MINWDEAPSTSGLKQLFDDIEMPSQSINSEEIIMGKKQPAKKALPVPAEQWDLPVSLGADGHWLTLKQAVETKAAGLSFGQLSMEQQADLVAQRIENQPKFEMAMVGPGIVGKERAIQEVRAQSSVGRTLMEIEQRMISRMLKRASGGES
jgi:hypothetical protein